MGSDTMRRAKHLLSVDWKHVEEPTWELNTDDPRWAIVAAAGSGQRARRSSRPPPPPTRVRRRARRSIYETSNGLERLRRNRAPGHPPAARVSLSGRGVPRGAKSARDARPRTAGQVL